MSKIIKFTIKGELCDLNVFLKALSNNRYGGGAIKKAETENVAYQIRKQKVPVIKDYPIKVGFNWYSKDSRKDIDNVAFAKKFLLDGMVLSGMIENDSRKFVKAFTDEFFIDSDNPRVEVEVIYG